MDESLQSFPSEDLARYIEQKGGIAKPWLLAQLRLRKLQERKDDLSPIEYERALEDIHQDVMNLGEWWLGVEAEEFE